MGLTPEQLLLLEEFSKKLRDGSHAHTGIDLRLIAELRQRNRLLEGRLAKFAAFVALPADMKEDTHADLNRGKAPDLVLAPKENIPRDGSLANGVPGIDLQTPKSQTYLQDYAAEELRKHIRALMTRITELEVRSTEYYLYIKESII